MAIREADALGMQDPTGNKSAVTDALSRAYRAYESTRGFDPHWVYLPEALLSGMTGIMQMYLGEHDAASTQIQARLTDLPCGLVNRPNGRCSASPTIVNCNQ
ncbi:hypothetical protein K8O92_00110 [Nocardia asteroides]|nr:hypothetical protein K8O92_00110 [Nocardia asteroides]